MGGAVTTTKLSAAPSAGNDLLPEGEGRGEGESDRGPNNCSLSLRSILNRALGPGHLHGMDLWWDGSRVVFGYARTPTDQPPEGWLDRARSYRLPPDGRADPHLRDRH